jgi:hypothetical protein
MAALATDMRARFSLLWVFVMLNMVYADILSFMSAGTLKDILAGHVGQIAFTPDFLLLAAVLTEVPIAMVVLSLVLPHRAARWANIGAAGFTIAYIWGMGSASPHYVFIAGIETLACIIIVWQAWKWRVPAASVRAEAVLAK